MLKRIEGLICSIVGGILWRLGGSDICPKSVRRYGIAGVMIYLVIRRTKNYIVGILSGVILFLATTVGYGIPDAGDSGSSLGRFFAGLGLEGNELVFFVRLTVGILYSLSYLPTIIYNKNKEGIIYMLVSAVAIPFICLMEPGAVIEEFLIGTVIIGMYTLMTRSKE